MWCNGDMRKRFRFRRLDFFKNFCHTPRQLTAVRSGELPPRHHISGMMRNPMRRKGPRNIALCAATARPDYRSSECGVMSARSGGFLSQQKQPGLGLRIPD
jgi:hypothetical protein